MIGDSFFTLLFKVSINQLLFIYFDHNLLNSHAKQSEVKQRCCSDINVQKNYIITDIAQIIFRSIPHTLDKIIIIKLCNTPVPTNRQETASP